MSEQRPTEEEIAKARDWLPTWQEMLANLPHDAILSRVGIESQIRWARRVLKATR